MRALTPSIAFAALIACGGEKANPPASSQAEPATATATPPTATAPTAPPPAERPSEPAPPTGERKLVQESFDVDQFEAARPPEIGQDGVVKEGARFADENGANVVVLVHQIEAGGDTNSRRLWAYHYIDEGSKRRMLRKLADKEENCELDNAAGWVDGSLQISDVDGDGLGEVTFAYDLGCRGDVSPKIRKLVVLEDGAKWILRGESRVDVGGGERAGGAFVADPAVKKWPQKIHQHAVAAWGRLVDR